MRPVNRTITFYNMNFGDSFLIQDNGEGLLVDCGVHRRCKQQLIALPDIIADLRALDRKKLLITHYHEDHFCKIIDLVKAGVRFDTIYVRNLDYLLLKFDFNTALLALTDYAIRTKDYETFRMWLDPKLLSNLLSAAGTVVGVNNSNYDSFKIGNSRANVLWPSPIETIDEKNRLLSIIEKIEDLLTIENDKVSKHIRRLYNLYISLTDRREKYISREFLEGQIERFQYFPDYESLGEEDFKNYLKKIKIPDKDRKEVNFEENHLSIVFEIDSKLLMCGDADKYAMACAIEKFNSCHGLSQGDIPIFDIVKVPHHGTRNPKYKCTEVWDRTTELLIPNSEKINKSLSIDSRFSYPYTTHCNCLNNDKATTSCQSTKGCSKCCNVRLQYKIFSF